jgi:hypothetical protein
MRRVVSLHYVNVARGRAAGRLDPAPRYCCYVPELNSRTIAAETTLNIAQETPCHRQSPARGPEIDR